MSIDLIDRVYYLKSKGDDKPFRRFCQWLRKSKDKNPFDFMVHDERYYWNELSSVEFNDIIDEDKTDWCLIYSETETLWRLVK